MFIDRGFTVKESKECGAGGSMVRLIWKLHLRIMFEQFCQIIKIQLIEHHENVFLQYHQGSFDYGEPWGGTESSRSHAQLCSWGIQGSSMPLKILFTTNNCPILSSSKMLLAFAFPSAQPESSNKDAQVLHSALCKGFQSYEIWTTIYGHILALFRPQILLCVSCCFPLVQIDTNVLTPYLSHISYSVL